MDAGSVLLQREGRPFPQHHHAERLHPYLPKWQRAVQHPNLTHSLLPHEPEVVSSG